MTRNYYNCESRVSFTNTSPTQKKVDDLKGKTVKVGEYDLVLDGELTAVEGKAGMFKGNGHVPWSPISIKWELEDLCFRYLHEKEYYDLVRDIAEKRVERENYIQDIVSDLYKKLEKRINKQNIWFEFEIILRKE